MTAMKVDVRGMHSLRKAMVQLSEGQIRAAARTALNRTGAGAYRAVVRTIVKENGFKRQKDVRLRFEVSRAKGRNLVWSAAPHRRFGSAIALKNLRPKQTGAGVDYKVAGQPHSRAGAFIVKKLGGHVFKRVGRSRFPIAKQYDQGAIGRMLSSPAVARSFKQSVPALWRRHWPSRLRYALHKAKARHRL